MFIQYEKALASIDVKKMTTVAVGSVPEPRLDTFPLQFAVPSFNSNNTTLASGLQHRSSVQSSLDFLALTGLDSPSLKHSSLPLQAPLQRVLD